jgi:hypothetical protein
MDKPLDPRAKAFVAVALVLTPSILLLGSLVYVLATPQSPGVELGPDHTQQGDTGQTIAYNHILTNTGTATDTFLLEVLSTQAWPAELLGGSCPNGTAPLLLQVGAQMTTSFRVSLTVPLNAAGVTEVTVITATSQLSPTVQDTAIDTTIVYHRIFLPFVAKRWPPIPDVPVLNPIDNTNQDNFYTVRWNNALLAETYVLEEATDASFSDARVVYQGTGLSWTVPDPGKTPATYHYRVKARNSWGDSYWSDLQTVVIYPLFVGLELRWDGEGYIRGSWVYDVGWHSERDLNGLTDADTIRSHNYSWYDPNPFDWDSETWDSYYSVTTGYFKSSSAPSDPSWKWDNPWILPYDWQFNNGQTFLLYGQAFKVSGPHSGYTSFGKAVQYWQLVNKDKFLYWDGGGDWTQYIHPGDITLWYDAGNTRLLLHRDVLRTYYKKGSPTSDTVHYITNLTSANAFPAVRGSACIHLQEPPNQSSVDDPVKESLKQHVSP